MRAQQLTGLAGAFAHVPVTGRVASLQNYSGALADEVDALYTNPAALLQVRTPCASFGYAKLYGLLPLLAAWGSFPASDRSTLGVGIVTSGDELYRESSLRLAFARLLIVNGRQLDLGAAVDLRFAEYGGQRAVPGDVSGQAWGAGISVGARLWLLSHFVLAVSLRDGVGWLNWESSASGRYNESVPASLVFGFALLRHEVVSMALDLTKSLTRDARDRICISAEKDLFELLYLRGSYALNATGEPFGSWGIGLGLRRRLGNGPEVRVDLGYTIEELPNTLRLTVSLIGQ